MHMHDVDVEEKIAHAKKVERKNVWEAEEIGTKSLHKKHAVALELDIVFRVDNVAVCMQRDECVNAGGSSESVLLAQPAKRRIDVLQ